MVINRHSHNLLCLVLANHIFIQFSLDNMGCRNILHSQLLFRLLLLF